MTPQEFEHIAHIVRPQMMRVAMDFFHQTEEAEDVVQEVLMRLWIREKTKKAPCDEELTALAIKATKNQCVSTWRKQKLRQAIPIDDSLTHIRSDERADKPLMTMEQAQTIDRAIRQLPRSEQRLILLKQTADLSSDEIATLTGIPIRAVRTMLSSARRNLLKLLKQ